MELYEEILVRHLSGCRMEISFPQLELSPEKIVEMECYRVLQEIKRILEDDSLDDKACFMKIEDIIRLFEEIGSDGGFRHDFG